MEYIYDIFFTTTFDNDYLHLLIRILFFQGSWGLLLYLSYLLIVKLGFRKKELRKDHQLKLAFLWSLGVGMMCFAIFFFFLLRYNGTGIFEWNENLIALVPMLLVPLASILLYLFSSRRFRQSISKLRIN